MSPHSPCTHFRRLAVNQFVVQPLVIPLVMVVGDEFRDRSSMVALAERNQTVQTFLFDRADEPFGVGVGIGRPIWCLDDANPRVLQARPHRPTPLGIPVADQHATPIGVSEREVPHDLAHERLVGMGRRAEDLDSPRGQVDHKDRIERDQAVPGPHFGREEICGGDLTPVRPQEPLPRGRTFRYGRNAGGSQDPCNR